MFKRWDKQEKGAREISIFFKLWQSKLSLVIRGRACWLVHCLGELTQLLRSQRSELVCLE